ncbi:NUDIX domain-containing protein [Streptomyces sp. NRRL S-350]|uniref:NUDIX domain-containing protein n=1 Tax=Streptomyces sp. NRRL S-350 TaxID=1463902 RepID=UPI0004C08F31|nr:NUDIX hydrolase [Streptomyces sp. NRRL S-350]
MESFLPEPDPQAGSWLPPEEFIATLPRATAYASLYITDEHGQPVLLNSSVYKPDKGQIWQFPGGQMDPGEPPSGAAIRETRQETGLTLKCGRLLAVHFLPPEPTWPANKFGLIFDGGALSPEQLASIHLDPAEHSDWAARPVEDWTDVLNPRSMDRLRQVAAAAASGLTAYIEHGGSDFVDYI